MTEELKPCPFCHNGGKPYAYTIGNNSSGRGRGAMAGCSQCKLEKRVGVIHYSVEWALEKVIEWWNTRAEEKD